MKKLSTLAAAASLTIAALGAQAQVTVSGTLTAAEINGPATSGDYVLLGQYPYGHSFSTNGLLSFYGANTPNKVQMFVGGTVQPISSSNTNQNSIQVFIDVPGLVGVPAGTTLPQPLANTFNTSLDGFQGKLDQAVELAIGLRSTSAAASAGAGNVYQVAAAVYYVSSAAGVTPATYAAQDTIISATQLDNGTVVTVPRISTRSRFSILSGARFAYQGTPDGTITTNPGYTTPLTAAPTGPLPAGQFGTAAGTTGFEIELDRTNAGLPTGNPTLNLFVQLNNGSGNFVSSDYIPNAVLPANNLQGNPDYTAIAGTQSAAFQLATVTLATRAADAAAIGLSIAPNPSNATSTVNYLVTERASNVNVTLTDLLGRSVRVLENSLKNVGPQTTTLDAASLAAGTYLVRVQVGDRVSTSKLSVL